jgi:hypothetical protein
MSGNIRLGISKLDDRHLRTLLMGVRTIQAASVLGDANQSPRFRM